MTLDEFLLARITEDEMVAKEVPGPSDEEGLSWWGEYGHLSVSPARVLAECEAKRRVIAAVVDVEWSGSFAVRDVVLSYLVLPYADHPDYREEWRP